MSKAEKEALWAQDRAMQQLEHNPAAASLLSAAAAAAAAAAAGQRPGAAGQHGMYEAGLPANPSAAAAAVAASSLYSHLLGSNPQLAAALAAQGNPAAAGGLHQAHALAAAGAAGAAGAGSWGAHSAAAAAAAAFQQQQAAAAAAAAAALNARVNSSAAAAAAAAGGLSGLVGHMSGLSPAGNARSAAEALSNAAASGHLQQFLAASGLANNPLLSQVRHTVRAAEAGAPVAWPAAHTRPPSRACVRALTWLTGTHALARCCPPAACPTPRACRRCCSSRCLRPATCQAWAARCRSRRRSRHSVRWTRTA
jgi:hypothetical protein